MTDNWSANLLKPAIKRDIGGRGVRTVKIGGVTGDFGCLSLLADDELGVPVGVAHSTSSE